MGNTLIEPFVDIERQAQLILDDLYRQKGFVVNRRNACRDYDVEIARDGVTLRVEEKIRTEDYEDILVEIVQDIVSGNAGWYAKTRCDRLMYAVVQDGRLVKTCIVDWRPFKEWLAEYIPTNQNRLRHRYSRRGYGVTLNVAIPVRDIPAACIWIRRY